MDEKAISELAGKLNLFINMYPQEMATFTQSYFNIVYQSVISGVSSKIYNQLSGYTNIIENIISDLDIDEDEEKQKVYYIAVIKALTEIIRKNAEEIEETNNYINYCSKFSYLKKILEFLNAEKGVTHSEMARHLGVKNNTLSNYINRIKDLGFFRTYSSGKNKLYFINTKGSAFYSSIEHERTKQNMEPVYNSLLSELFKILIEEIQSSNPDANRIMGKIRKANIRNLNYFSSYDMKQNVSKLVSIVNKLPESGSQLENYNIVRSSYYKGITVYGSSIRYTCQTYLCIDYYNMKSRPNSFDLIKLANSKYNGISCMENSISPSNIPLILMDKWGDNTESNQPSIVPREFVYAHAKTERLHSLKPFGSIWPGITMDCNKMIEKL